jgi:NAD(P)-dependent dehydrogenase (short-subunit alcohol dehydrogenase family)
MLLRDGAHLTITTRFPKRCRAPLHRPGGQRATGSHRLKIVGIDLRDPTQVVALADEVAAAGPLDILINNACQTVRRTPGAYAPLVDGEIRAAAPTAYALCPSWSPSTGSSVMRTRPRSRGLLRARGSRASRG